MAEIYVLTITYGPTATQENLFYKTWEGAKNATSSYDKGNANFSKVIEDDFGTSVTIKSMVHGFRLSSLEKSLDVQIEQNLMQARAQGKYNRLAASDPILKLAGGNVLPFRQ